MFEVLEAARHAGSRVVFPSTASIFDASNALPLSERAFPRPTSPYAAGKLGGEAYCHAYHRSYGVDVRIARLFSVYGIGMFRFAIHDIVRKIQQDHDDLVILGDGTQVRDYLFIDDAVRGLTMVATEGASGEEYNVASGAPVRLLELARLIAELMGYPNIRIRPTRTVVCRRHRALVRRHFEGARARIRAARHSARRTRAHDRVAGDAAGPGRGDVMTASRRRKSSSCCRTSSAACSATSATSWRIAGPTDSRMRRCARTMPVRATRRYPRRCLRIETCCSSTACRSRTCTRCCGVWRASFRDGPGVVVANDWIELALTSIYDSGRAVVAINHGDFDFYYDLAVRHRDTIDAFVTYTERMCHRLRQLLPGSPRFDFSVAVRGRYSGVGAAPGARPAAAALRRTAVEGQRHLRSAAHRSTAAGARASRCCGPFRVPDRMRRSSRRTGPIGRDIRWTGQQPKRDVLRLYEQHDVLVMPSRGEGLPVALLEGGAAALVPVVSDLASGIPEVVESGVSGYRAPVGDIGAFADAIAALDRDRHRLESMSAAVRDVVVRRFDATQRTVEYQRLFARWRELKRARPPHPRLHYGSRLDQPWMPNTAVKMIRSVLRWA